MLDTGGFSCVYVAHGNMFMTSRRLDEAERFCYGSRKLRSALAWRVLQDMFGLSGRILLCDEW